MRLLKWMVVLTLASPVSAALTAFPTVVFNSSTGSDTAASGAGPATAVTGTASASTNSTTVTFSSATDLSGVAQDGSHVLWVSGVGFVRISTVNDAADSMVVETALTIGAGTSMAIGGKRATFDNTESRRLFAATSSPTASGATGGWTISLEDDQTLTSTLPLTCTAGTGSVMIQSSSAGTRRNITQSINDQTFSNTNGAYTFTDCQFRNSNDTKTAAHVFETNGGSIVLRQCIVGASDGTNCPLSTNVWYFGGGTTTLLLFNSAVFRTTGTGFTSGGSIHLRGCLVSRCGGAGVTVAIVGALYCEKSLITHNSGSGIASSLSVMRVIDTTIDQNSGDGIYNSNGGAFVDVTNCSITGNTGYGINLPSGNNVGAVIEYNNFGTGGTANTSGSAYSTISLSSTNLTVDPGYTNSASGTQNYSPGTNLKAAGFPSAIGLGLSGTTSYLDIGATQRQEGSGGGGVSRARVVNPQ